MKIESIIKRPKGSYVDLDAPKRTYHFAPENGDFHSPHVCDVNIDHHAATLLRIKDGYRLVEGEKPPEGDLTGDDIGDQLLIGSEVHSASYPIKGGETVELGDLVNMAFEDSGLTVDVWNKLPDQERYDYIDATLKELQQGVDSGDDGEGTGTTDTGTTGVGDTNIAKGTGNNVSGETGGQQGSGTTSTKPETKDEVSEELTKAELAEKFKARFGREPSNRMSKADLVHALSEDDE